MTCQPSKIKMESEKCWCPNLRLLQGATLRFYASFLRCMRIRLVVWTNLKNIRQIGILPQIDVQKKNIWNHNLYPFTCWRFVKHEASFTFPWLQVEVNSSNEDYLFLAMLNIQKIGSTSGNIMLCCDIITKIQTTNPSIYDSWFMNIHDPNLSGIISPLSLLFSPKK